MGSTLTNLKYMAIVDNLLTGMIPTSLSNASGLETIHFTSNDFTGPMPKDLGKLSGLRRIGFYGNRLEDDLSFISTLTNCTSSQGFDIGNNRFRGLLPDSISNLSATFNIIAMEDNQLHGSIPSGIANLLNLRVLDMARNHLSGPIPTSIGKLHNLREVFLERNNFIELPSSVGNLTLLNILHLVQNNIYGSIPPSLGNCHKLLAVYLSHNNFNGSIPHEIMSLSSISITFNIAHNALTGVLPPEVGSLKNLVELDVSNNRLSGLIPNSLSNCLSLERLSLEGNSFEGEIPQSLRELRGLRVLDLSQNNFSGLIPSFLGDLQLEKLNVSFNVLHGEVPMKGVFQNGSTISVIGNIDLCGGIADLNLHPCPSSKSNKNKMSLKVKVIIISVVVSLAIGVTLVVCIFIFLHRRQVSKKKASSMPSFKDQLLRVSYAELLKATSGFSEANLIGFGSYASVYKGVLNQGQMVVAVKVLNVQLSGAARSFMSECKALRMVRHRNLLKIMSVCSSVDFHGNEFKALICEFMTNGTLQKWLHEDQFAEHGNQEEPRILKLVERLDISIDIASALEYLHRGCDPTIVHGDLKPSNVLLDDEMTAHVGDFGLAKVISTVSTEIAQHRSNSVAINGTIGYIAPEYGMGEMASTLGDVYSFGILLLEMFTGKKPTDDMFKDDLSLRNFVRNALPDEVIKIVDPRILLEHNTRSWIKDCMVSFLRIGVACPMESPEDRMEMGSVVRELNYVKNTYVKPEFNQD